jgi:5-methylcytosine-specific restriction protein A
MSLNAALNLFLDVYQIAVSEPSIGNAVAEFTRREIPAAVAQIIGKNNRYIVHGSSPGQNSHGYIPWVAIYDRFVAEIDRDNFYVVYLVPEDYSGFYLSLNQDAPIFRRVYGPDAKGILAARASDHMARLGRIGKPFIPGPIDLKVTSTSSVGAFYEQGSICARYYRRGEIPDDEVLGKDLKEFLKLHLLVAAKGPVIGPDGPDEDGETAMILKTSQPARTQHANKIETAEVRKEFTAIPVMRAGSISKKNTEQSAVSLSRYII